MILTDSDILIELVRGRNAALLGQWQWILNSSETLACTPINVAELWSGVRKDESHILETTFNALLCIPLDDEVGRMAGDLLRKYGPSHGVHLSDALIGAAAIVHGATLWTRNRKHYPAKGLRFLRRPTPRFSSLPSPTR